MIRSSRERLRIWSLMDDRRSSIEVVFVDLTYLVRYALRHNHDQRLGLVTFSGISRNTSTPSASPIASGGSASHHQRLRTASTSSAVYSVRGARYLPITGSHHVSPTRATFLCSCGGRPGCSWRDPRKS